MRQDKPKLCRNLWLWGGKTKIEKLICVMQTVLNGTDWDYTSTDEEKYETIKEAYIYFLQNNIYKD